MTTLGDLYHELGFAVIPARWTGRDQPSIKAIAATVLEDVDRAWFYDLTERQANAVRRACLELGPITWELRDVLLGLHWRKPACEYGPSGHCQDGDHEKCAHRAGGLHQAGVWTPDGCLGLRLAGGQIGTARGGAHIAVGTCHVWRCPCDCHATEQEALW